MALAGWFYIIRRHITVETPLDKRNLERRDRIFVRTTYVKNHPERPGFAADIFLLVFASGVRFERGFLLLIILPLPPLLPVLSIYLRSRDVARLS